jgi:hypothetical protein
MVQRLQQHPCSRSLRLKPRLFRRYLAPVSAGVLILVAAFAFASLQGTYSGPAPILDPNFKLWTSSSGGSQLSAWNLESIKGSDDQVTLNETTIDARDAAQLAVFQSGGRAGWVYVGLTQTLDGARLSALLKSTIGIWFLKEPCRCDDYPFNTTAVTLIVEINDGIHTISYIFSDKHEGTLQLLNHELIFRRAPSGVWTFQEFNFTKEYATAHWDLPTSLTFRIIFGVGQNSQGWHYAYLNRITAANNVSQIVQSMTASQPAVPAAVTSRDSD